MELLKLTKVNRFLRFLSSNTLGVIIFLGVLNGLLYIFLVPPWQHYDEPAHFEFAWRLANRGIILQSDDFEDLVKRELLTSMVEHGFFNGMTVRPRIAAAQNPVWIGISQRSDFPLYYLWVSLPLWFFRRQEIDFQLYIARTWSALLYLFVLYCAYRLAKEAAPDKPIFHWVFPLSLALWPSFTDLMTAVNDDVGAIALASGSFWLSVALARGKLRWPWVLIIITIGIMAVMVKSTALPILPVILAACIFYVFRNRPKYAWVVLSLGIIGVLLVCFSWGDAAFWLRLTNQVSNTRQVVAGAPSGKHAIALEIKPGQENEQALQKIPLSELHPKKSVSYTLGAWMWADRPTKAASPAILLNRKTFVKGVTLSERPVFVTISAEMESPIESLWVKLKPFSRLSSPVTVYYDGLILVEGKFSADFLTMFENPTSSNGHWQDELTNLLRNPSAEQAWPRLRPWVDRLGRQNFPGHMSLILQSLLDPTTSAWYYQASLRSLTQTFWGKFGWGHVPLRASHPYRWLSLTGMIGVLSALLWTWRNRQRVDKRLILVMGLFLAGVWGMALLRGIDSIVGEVFIPSARYAFPAIIPTLLAIIGGWFYLLSWLCKWLGLPKVLPAALILVFCTALNLFGVWSIYFYYYSR